MTTSPKILGFICIAVILVYGQEGCHIFIEGKEYVITIAPITPTKSISGSATPTVSVLKDSRDNKTYKTIKIGTQTWMAENLSYNAGGSRCYDNLGNNCKKYGRLYNWSMAKSACPKGWHLPSKVEWAT